MEFKASSVYFTPQSGDLNSRIEALRSCQNSTLQCLEITSLNFCPELNKQYVVGQIGGPVVLKPSKIGHTLTFVIHEVGDASKEPIQVQLIGHYAVLGDCMKPGDLVTLTGVRVTKSILCLPNQKTPHSKFHISAKPQFQKNFQLFLMPCCATIPASIADSAITKQNGIIIGIVEGDSNFVLFTHLNEAEIAIIPLRSNTSVKPCDLQKVKELFHWWSACKPKNPSEHEMLNYALNKKIAALRTNQGEISNKSKVAEPGKKLENRGLLASLSQLNHDMYFDIKCQVVACYQCDTPHKIILKIWDGTKCPYFTGKKAVCNLWKTIFADSSLEDLEEYCVNVNLFDRFVSHAATIKLHDILILKNVHAHADILNLKDGQIRERGISIVSQQSQKLDPLKVSLKKLRMQLMAKGAGPSVPASPSKNAERGLSKRPMDCNSNQVKQSPKKRKLSGACDVLDVRKCGNETPALRTINNEADVEVQPGTSRCAVTSESFAVKLKNMGPQSSFSKVIHDMYFDIFCQVLACYRHCYFVLLKVWDGTRFPYPSNESYDDGSFEILFEDNDLAKIKQFCVDIKVFDKHMDCTVKTKCKDILHLRNVQSSNGTLRMPGGEIRNRGIFLCPPQSEKARNLRHSLNELRNALNQYDVGANADTRTRTDRNNLNDEAAKKLCRKSNGVKVSGCNEHILINKDPFSEFEKRKQDWLSESPRNKEEIIANIFPNASSTPINSPKRPRTSNESVVPVRDVNHISREPVASCSTVNTSDLTDVVANEARRTPGFYSFAWNAYSSKIRNWNQRKSFSDVKMDMFFDIYCQVVACYFCEKLKKIILKVWDGTECPYSYGKDFYDTWVTRFEDPDLAEIDKYCVNVNVYDEFMNKANNLKLYDVVKLGNCQCLSGIFAIHGGKIRKRGIFPCLPLSDIFQSFTKFLTNLRKTLKNRQIINDNEVNLNSDCVQPTRPQPPVIMNGCKDDSSVRVAESCVAASLPEQEPNSHASKSNVPKELEKDRSELHPVASTSKAPMPVESSTSDESSKSVKLLKRKVNSITVFYCAIPTSECKFAPSLVNNIEAMEVPATFCFKGTVIDVKPNFIHVNDIVKWCCKNCLNCFSAKDVAGFEEVAEYRYRCPCGVKQVASNKDSAPNSGSVLKPIFKLHLALCDKDHRILKPMVSGRDAEIFFRDCTPTEFLKHHEVREDFSAFLKRLCPHRGRLTSSSLAVHCHMVSRKDRNVDIAYDIVQTRLLPFPEIVEYS